MQVVGHNGFRDRTVAFNQLRTEIKVKNTLAVIEFGKRFIDLENFSALRAECFTAREDAEHDKFCVRLAAADLLHDGRDPFEDFSLGIVLTEGIIAPIMRTATFALIPFSWPFSHRHKTCWVRSPLTPRLMTLR